MSKVNLFCLMGCMLVTSFVGCGSQSALSPEILAARQKLLLNEPPADPIQIADARKLEPKSDIVVVGKLGIAGQPTFEKGQATFAITDAHPKLATHKHGDGQDESDCPFCKRSKGERLALVQVVDDQGEVLKLDGESLLGAHEGDEIVIHGKGEVNSLDVLVINAEGVFVKRP